MYLKNKVIKVSNRIIKLKRIPKNPKFQLLLVGPVLLKRYLTRRTPLNKMPQLNLRKTKVLLFLQPTLLKNWISQINPSTKKYQSLPTKSQDFRALRQALDIYKKNLQKQTLTLLILFLKISAQSCLI